MYNKIVFCRLHLSRDFASKFPYGIIFTFPQHLSYKRIMFLKIIKVVFHIYSKIYKTCSLRNIIHSLITSFAIITKTLQLQYLYETNWSLYESFNLISSIFSNSVYSNIINLLPSEQTFLLLPTQETFKSNPNVQCNVNICYSNDNKVSVIYSLEE